RACSAPRPGRAAPRCGRRRRAASTRCAGGDERTPSSSVLTASGPAPRLIPPGLRACPHLPRGCVVASGALPARSPAARSREFSRFALYIPHLRHSDQAPPTRHHDTTEAALLSRGGDIAQRPGLCPPRPAQSSWMPLSFRRCPGTRSPESGARLSTARSPAIPLLQRTPPPEAPGLALPGPSLPSSAPVRPTVPAGARLLVSCLLTGHVGPRPILTACAAHPILCPTVSPHDCLERRL